MTPYKNICTIFTLLLSISTNLLLANQVDQIIFNHAFHINEVELNCEECHDGIKYTENVSWNVFPDMDLCLSCHDGDTADDDCEKCHTNADEPLAFSESWTVSNHEFSHKRHIDSIEDCSKCHSYINDDEGTDPPKTWTQKECNNCHSIHKYTNPMTACISCHTDFHEGNNGQDCQVCHNTNSWIIPNAIEIHQFSRFPLVGPHIFADCQDCHTSGSLLDFPPLNVDCFSCHAQDYLTAQVPNHVSNNLSQECEDCHKIIGPTWNFGFSDHSFFPLIGGHSFAICSDCHTQNSFQNIGTDCNSCHQTNYSATVDPNHTSLGFSTDCDECHTTNPGWNPVNIDHDIFYILTGAHINIKNDCNSCHINGYSSTTDECYSCHQADYSTTIDPNHISLGFSTDCEECHTTNPGWSPVNIDHDVFYPLIGGHNSVKDDCSNCHAQGYNNTTDYCFNCHVADYGSTVDPNHTQYQFPQDCETCHNTNPGWSPMIFDHNAVFPLLGGHEFIKTDCLRCHSSGFNNILTECADCHISDYNSTSEPNHVNEQFSTSCEECHTTNPNWTPIVFDHNTAYPLLGGHNLVKTDCSKCHSLGYSNTSSECDYCHLADYNSTTNPNHFENQFVTDCSECHTTNPGWTPASIDHSTIYPLLGGHDLIKTDCNKCHLNGYINTPSNCEDCHISDYNSTTSPNHINNQFPQECDTCHNTNSGWNPTIFDHNTVFPLLGGHELIKTACNRCHSTGYYNINSNCENCHLTDYNNTTNPNHVTNLFPKDCEDCHTSNPGWSPTIFDHNSVYPLLGGHRIVKDNCILCHSSGYSNISTACSSCHISDYNSTTSPSHITENFSTNCTKCHNTNPGWSPTIFDHNTVFPLLGGHNLISTNCAQCHSSGYSNTSSECVSCHLNEYNSTVNPNHSSSQFPQDCELCHDTGPGWTPSTFNHDGLYFPIYSGDHKDKWDNCSICHINSNNYSQFSCLNCHKHNENSMRQEHTKNGSLIYGYVYDSYACYDCHPNGSD